MGVAKFTGTVEVEKICDEIRNNAVITDSERRRRLVHIEIAISEAIQGLLAAGATDSVAIRNEIDNKVVGKYLAWKAAGGDLLPVAWPFPR